jgi:hypothetical protein
MAAREQRVEVAETLIINTSGTKPDKAAIADALSAQPTVLMSVVVVIRKPFHSNEKEISHGRVSWQRR